MKLARKAERNLKSRRAAAPSASGGRRWRQAGGDPRRRLGLVGASLSFTDTIGSGGAKVLVEDGRYALRAAAGYAAGGNGEFDSGGRFAFRS